MKSHLLCCCFFLLFLSCKNTDAEKSDGMVENDTLVEEIDNLSESEPQVLANYKYVEIGKKNLSYMEKGDMDSWMNIYADNAVYLWNSGDSLVGKAAIAFYWKQRRVNVIERIRFKDAIWLPVTVKEPQSVEAKGVWLLAWYKATVKYRNGKEMTQWIHTDYHFDSNDKVDRVVQYVDRAAINASLPK